jgi:purine-binding chemotaxis protein CheW
MPCPIWGQTPVDNSLRRLQRHQIVVKPPWTRNNGRRVNGRATAAEVVSFHVDDRTYALPLEQVVEVVRMVAVTPVPDAPPWLAGVINLRGTLIPMIDLRPRFGAAPTEIDPSHVFLVAQVHGRTAGVMADLVEDVVQLDGTAVEHGQADGEVMGALARSTTGAVVMLDLARLLEGADAGGQARGDDERAAHSTMV